MAKRDSKNRQAQAFPTAPAQSPPAAEVRKVAGICLGLVGLVFLAFWPSVSNGFVNLDDPMYVTENRHVLGGLTWQGISWAFTSLEAGFWHPLTWLSLMSDCQVFGLHAGGHHLVSLLLHATNTLLLFLILRRMTGATWRSAAVAVLFALHPLHVESVAWVSDRKDVLSTFFCLLALLAYTSYVQHSKASGDEPSFRIRLLVSRFTLHASRYYLLSLFFFVCALMSKATVLTMPLIFLLLDWWPLRRVPLLPLRHLLVEKLPFLALSALAALTSVYGQNQAGAVGGVALFPVGDRIANAALSFVRYLAQTIWPFDLAAYYPFPATLPVGLAVGAGLVTLAGSALLLGVARSRPYLAVGWLWFIVTLLPVIGLLQIGGHSRADRYTYVPLIGLFLLLVWAAHDFTKRWRYQVICLSSAGVIVVSLCLALTRSQIEFWKNSETLLRHAIAVTGDNSMAQNNLGVALTKQGQLGEAVTCLQEAIRLVPHYAEAYNNLGTALAMQGRLDEAIPCFRESLRLKPHYAQAQNDLGLALARKGLMDEAIPCFQEAVKLVPDFADARCNLGDALSAKQRFDEAITQYQQAVQLNPGYPDAYNHLGIALSSKGRLDEAISQFQQALKLNPYYPEAHGNLGAALARKGRFDEAVIHLQEAVRLRPDYAAAQNNLRAALAAKAAVPHQPGLPPLP